MKVDINEIIVGETVRIRKDVGDLDTLQSSIAKVGLINPVLVDENNTLIAGFRRLTACQNLGWKEIEVSVVTLNGDRIKMLDVEIAENFFRKDFTPDEILATEKRRQEIMEEQRELGFWEKFWVWLKSFFLPKPQEPQQPTTGDETKSSPPTDEDAGDIAGAEEVVTEPSESASEPLELDTEPSESAREPSKPVTDPSESTSESSEVVTESSESITETDDPDGEEKSEKAEQPATKPG